MGYTLYFSDQDELMNFVDYATETHAWGVRKFTLSSAGGATMDIDTRGGGTDGYVNLASVKGYINQYKENNPGLQTVINFKLICPEGYRQSIDPDNYYSAFYLNVYSSGKLSYVSLTYAERGVNLVEAPFLSWVAYVRAMFRKWKTLYTGEVVLE